MAVKRKISAAEYEALSDEMKAHYKLNGKDYVLDADDADELSRGLAREKEGKTKAETERDALQARLDALNEAETLRQLGDVKTLDASWKAKHDAAMKEAGGKLTARETLAKNLALRGVADKLAAELFTVPDVMVDRIIGRLDADLDVIDPTTGLPTVKVKGPDGKISALTTDDLKKEFREDKKLAKIVIANRSSGSAGNRDLPKFPASGGMDGDKPPDLSKLTPKQLVELRKSTQPEEQA
jgi:hypothetical protein